MDFFPPLHTVVTAVLGPKDGFRCFSSNYDKILTVGFIQWHQVVTTQVIWNNAIEQQHHLNTENFYGC
jgi:hypothetical protein